MYLTRITLAGRVRTNDLLRHTGDMYREHQMLWKLFPEDPDARRDFLYRKDILYSRPRYFILSERMPVHDLGLWRIDPPREFAPRLRRGQRLQFSLRANPVVRVDGRRHDIVMHQKTALRARNDEEAPPLGLLIHTAGAAWIDRQAERHGFAVLPESLRVDGYRQHRARQGARRIRFSTLDFHGLLTVTDPDRFLAKLCAGFGAAKAFGCGLMLIRRP
ncbi:MAG: type I-E CRISPR-associated protein Cas6/Cse3/CasE [Candidatus Dadabacteria bacterium]|nr:MAG: type I-E CRISPR-associated protein Cas6/Cse3/CasE [Candidatus Dadabacteria bacterium]